MGGEEIDLGQRPQNPRSSNELRGFPINPSQDSEKKISDVCKKHWMPATFLAGGQQICAACYTRKASTEGWTYWETFFSLN